MPDARMPDFENGLEAALREQITKSRRRRRVVMGGAGVVGATAVITAALAAAGGGSGLAPNVASARPLPKVASQPVAVPAPSDAEIGVAGALTSQAREFSVGKYRGFVVPRISSKEWCISVPDLDTRSPEVERGTACVSDNESLRRDGLSIKVGTVVAAAPAVGAAPPTRTYRGERQTVPLNEAGVALITDLRVGERFTVYGIDGEVSSFQGEAKMVPGPDCVEDGKPVLNRGCSLVPEAS